MSLRNRITKTLACALLGACVPVTMVLAAESAEDADAVYGKAALTCMAAQMAFESSAEALASDYELLKTAEARDKYLGEFDRGIYKTFAGAPPTSSLKVLLLTWYTQGMESQAKTSEIMSRAGLSQADRSKARKKVASAVSYEIERQCLYALGGIAAQGKLADLLQLRNWKS